MIILLARREDTQPVIALVSAFYTLGSMVSLPTTACVSSATLGIECAITLCLFHLFYFASFECSPLQASPGKLLFGLKVIDSNDRALSLPKAFARTVARNLWIGFSCSSYCLRLPLVLKRSESKQLLAWRQCVQWLRRPELENQLGAYVVDRNFRAPSTGYRTGSLIDLHPAQLFQLAAQPGPLLIHSLLPACPVLALVAGFGKALSVRIGCTDSAGFEWTFSSIFFVQFVAPMLVLCAQIWWKKTKLIQPREVATDCRD